MGVIAVVRQYLSVRTRWEDICDRCTFCCHERDVTVTKKGNRFIKVAFDKKVPKWSLKKKVRLDFIQVIICILQLNDISIPKTLLSQFLIIYAILNDQSIFGKFMSSNPDR